MANFAYAEEWDEFFKDTQPRELYDFKGKNRQAQNANNRLQQVRRLDQNSMQEMQQAGASTIAQDEKTSVVWGMPGEAVKLNAADYILPLEQIAAKILALSES
jgi:hypothetical protein